MQISPKFSTIFSGEFLGYTAHYAERVQQVLATYDVVIFMARKAVCFYEAMVLNGVITPTDCLVLSSRVLDYNMLDQLAGRTVAVVEDVAVRGESLKRVLDILRTFDISADILILACSRHNVVRHELEHYHNAHLMSSCISLEEPDVYAFAGMITEYIEASMCPFNIDQPKYDLDLTGPALNEFLYQNYAVEITSELQRTYGIRSHVIYLEADYGVLGDRLGAALRPNFLKVRILSNGSRTVALPFVLLPTMADPELELLLGVLGSGEARRLVDVENPLVTRENKMKVVAYLLSEILLSNFLVPRRVGFRKQVRNDVLHFARDTNDGLKATGSSERHLFDGLTGVHFEFGTFEFPNWLAACYQAISSLEPGDPNYLSAKGEPLADEVIITHRLLSNSLEGVAPDPRHTASCAIDVLIDRGMIVPSVVHTPDGQVLRAYKKGEYSKLTETQLDAFQAMLYQYRQKTGRKLGKTEFEKLCVCFFRTAILLGHFKQQPDYEDECYSICYSLYGPRVSTSPLSYKVGSDSTLITKFCRKSANTRNIARVEVDGDKYEIP